MKILSDASINKELIVTSELTLSGEIIVNSNIVVKESGHLIVRRATLYFDEDCGIECKGLFEAIGSTFDSKGLNWGEIYLHEKSSSKSLLKNCSILNGSGLFINNSHDIVVDSCIVANCKSKLMRQSAITSAGTNITIRNCKISECESLEWHGGGISMYGDTLLVKCIIQDCKSNYSGGGIAMYGGKIKDCKIERCFASHSGGGITFQSVELEGIESESESTIQSTTISECRSGRYGGGIDTSDCKVSFDNVEIADCIAKSDGGGINLGYNSYVESLRPSKIIRCKSKGGIFDYQGNAIHEDPQDGKTKIDNFIFIDCIQNQEDKEETLISATCTWGGYMEINNCKAYKTLPNGNMMEYQIEDYIENIHGGAEIMIDGKKFLNRNS